MNLIQIWVKTIRVIRIVIDFRNYGNTIIRYFCIVRVYLPKLIMNI